MSLKHSNVSFLTYFTCVLSCTPDGTGPPGLHLSLSHPFPSRSTNFLILCYLPHAYFSICPFLPSHLPSASQALFLCYLGHGSTSHPVPSEPKLRPEFSNSGWGWCQNYLGAYNVQIPGFAPNTLNSYAQEWILKILVGPTLQMWELHWSGELPGKISK